MAFFWASSSAIFSEGVVINFRYHVVSLAAVFLALAIGLVVGTAAANGPIADNLKDQFNNVSADNQQLRDQLDQRTADLNKASEFATESAPVLLAGKLSKSPPVIVPGTAVFLTADPMAAPPALLVA